VDTPTRPRADLRVEAAYRTAHWVMTVQCQPELYCARGQRDHERVL
jgi:hypothetical protein